MQWGGIENIAIPIAPLADGVVHSRYDRYKAQSAACGLIPAQPSPA